MIRMSSLKSNIGTGVIGFGYWGPKLARNFANNPACNLVAVSDTSADRRQTAAELYPGVGVTSDYRQLISNPRVDAVAICTPVSSHFDLALACLRAGKHVIVEKPIANTTEQAARLIEEADRRGLVLIVDHTFLYTGAVRKIRELIEQGVLGDLYYYDSVRVNLGLFQHDVNVLWDLAVHDLSIMDHLTSRVPCAVSAVGANHIPGTTENIAYLTVFFEGNLIAHVGVNWLAPVKVRRTLIGGSKKMIVYDDLEPSEKVKVYDNGVTLGRPADRESAYRLRVGYRTGDMLAQNLDRTEALRNEVVNFVQCIHSGAKPISDGLAGLRVVRILQAASQSLAQRGRPVDLDHVRSASA